MEVWFIILMTIPVALFLRALLNLLSPTKPPSLPLPPGPSFTPIIGTFSFLRKFGADTEQTLRNLHAEFGPIISLNIFSRVFIFISGRSLAYQALVQKGATFSDRPKPPATIAVFTSNQRNITTAAYGPTWRLLRRNLASEILHPSRINSYTHARKWAFQILSNSIELENKTGKPVRVKAHFRYAMFSLLVLICFGEKLNQEQIKEIEESQHRVLLAFRVRFSILNSWPRLSKILLPKKWEEIMEVREDLEKVLVPLIRARNDESERKKTEHGLAYVDTLFDLQLPEEENRKLEEGEMVTLCSEFLNAGTDTTSSALQWIMANLVKYPHIQEKMYREIEGVVGDGAEDVKEDDLHKMSYLKSVILEGLRRHPPSHFVALHTVTEDAVLDGYMVPKGSNINFMVADIGWDPKVWEDPMDFKPERFLSPNEAEAFDITGSREIKMMPFGAGRRICPGLGLAMLHLEYFVANLVWKFEWKAVEGDEIKLDEKQEFTTVMKYPLQAHILPRKKI